MSLLSDNFTLAEFQAASHITLPAWAVSRATWWAQVILQPARDRLGRLRVTSFYRPADRGSAHETADAVDIVPLDVSVRAAADWFAVNKLRPYGELVQVIDERDHVHLASRLVPGATAGYLHEPTEGDFAFASPDPRRITQGDYRKLLAAGAAVGILAVVLG